MFTANTQNLLNQAANASLVAAADGGNAEAVAKAISEGADLRYLDQKSNQTALHAAAKAGSVPCVQVLLRANADVNAVNGVNATPLIYAAQKGHLDVVQALLAGGAKHDIVTRKGKTALVLAQEKGHAGVIAALQQVGASGGGGVQACAGPFGGLGAGGGATAPGPFGSAAATGGACAFGGGASSGGAPAGGGLGFGSGACAGASATAAAPPAAPAFGAGLGTSAASGAPGTGLPFGGAFGAAAANGASAGGQKPSLFGGGTAGPGASLGGSGGGGGLAGSSLFGGGGGGGAFGALGGSQPAAPSLTTSSTGATSAASGAPSFFGSAGAAATATSAPRAADGGAAAAGTAASADALVLPHPPEDGVSSLAFASYARAGADGAGSPATVDLLAATSWDGTTRVWSVPLDAAAASSAAQAGVRLVSLHAAPAPALCCAWTPDASSPALLRAGLDNQITLHHVADGASAAAVATPTAVGAHADAVKTLHVDAAAPSLVLSSGWDRALHGWDLRAGAGKPVSTVSAASRVTCADVRFPLAAVGTAIVGSIFMYDLRKPTEPLTVAQVDRLKYAPRCVALAPRASFGAAATSAEPAAFCVGTYEGRVAVQPTASGAASGAVDKFTFKCHWVGEKVFALNTLTFSPRTGALLSAGGDGNALLWDIHQRKKLQQLPPASQSVSCAAFDGEGRTVAEAICYDWTRGREGFDPAKPIEVRLCRVMNAPPRAQS